MKLDWVWQLLRYGLIFGGGFLVQRGMATEEQVSTVIGAVTAVAPIVWGVWVKYGTSAVSDKVILASEKDVNVKTIVAVSSATGQLK